MIQVITSQNVDDYPELMEQVWRFRHRQFVERLGWKELRSDDGRETDRFDTDDAVHLIATLDDKVIGYTRLLRTSGPHLLSDVYPEIMQGQAWPRSRDVYEWTRCISDDSAGKIGNVQASHMLITGVLEFCLLSSIKGLIVETHPKLVTWMLETGYQVETLNAPQIINGVPVVPVFIPATASALQRHHTMFGIRDSVLSIDDGLTNPVIGHGLLRHLPGLVAARANQPAFLPEVDFTAMRESAGNRSN
ncbi:GNAT family N-acetyltransferase [Rhizobium sp. KVB221]|uniref:Acyl-homoserine-lactone synthase n=1 Tax=Rhizobium setariae TaxID=2801340 RepID=A0A936YS33_9HYPH|nr:acyl-homoserine-lactone synthase [Rhizobium setariae]MBL0371355.1 GNAT family N-acetyltransferase [Rhizobium setariae]